MWAPERIGLQESVQVNGAGFMLEIMEMNMNTESNMWGEKRRERPSLWKAEMYMVGRASLRRGVRGNKGG